MKSILITGAGGNLGRAVINEIASDHFLHAALGMGEDAKFFMEHPAKENIETSFINLMDEMACEAYVANLIQNTHDRISAAILLVGGWQKGSLEETSLSDIDKMIKLNFATAFNVVRPLIEYFKSAGKGRLIFIGARPAINANEAREQFAYAISKSMIIKMAEIINQANTQFNIQAHVIIPSVLDTPQNRLAMPDANPADWVKPDHIAQTIRFLLSDPGNDFRDTLLKIYNKA